MLSDSGPRAELHLLPSRHDVRPEHRSVWLPGGFQPVRFDPVLSDRPVLRWGGIPRLLSGRDGVRPDGAHVSDDVPVGHDAVRYGRRRQSALLQGPDAGLLQEPDNRRNHVLPERDVRPGHRHVPAALSTPDEPVRDDPMLSRRPVLRQRRDPHVLSAALGVHAERHLRACL